MRTNIGTRAEKKAISVRNRTEMIWKWRVLPLFAALAAMLGAAGCDEYYGYYGAHPGYGPYYGSYGPYGPGYYVGRAYYVWRPGHWACIITRDPFCFRRPQRIRILDSNGTVKCLPRSLTEPFADGPGENRKS